MTNKQYQKLSKPAQEALQEYYNQNVRHEYYPTFLTWITTVTKEEAFDAYLIWEGILGYTLPILNFLEAFND